MIRRLQRVIWRVVMGWGRSDKEVVKRSDWERSVMGGEVQSDREAAVCVMIQGVVMGWGRSDKEAAGRSDWLFSDGEGTK